MAAFTVEEVHNLWSQVIKGYERPIITVSIEDALGHVLAEDLIAKTAIPSFRKSPYDGYAMAYDSSISTYQVMGRIGAGVRWSEPVKKGQAIRIMTGAPLPSDCDTVIMQEQCLLEGDYITIQGSHAPGDNVIPIGEECQVGDRLVEAGCFIDGGVLSIAVGLGYTQIKAYAPLKVALITSGKEIVEPGATRQEGNVFNSNRYMLRGLLHDESIFHVIECHISDDESLLEAEITRLSPILADVDFVVSTGGVSVGDFDCMPLIYERLGAKRLYNRLRMRPGAASYGAVRYINRQGKLVPQCIWGLSGNPAAAFNSWHLVAVPIIRRLQGCKHADVSVLNCTIEDAIHKKNPMDRYVQGRVFLKNGNPIFRPNKLFSGSALLGLQRVNGLAKIHQGCHQVEAGEIVEVYLLQGII